MAECSELKSEGIFEVFMQVLTDEQFEDKEDIEKSILPIIEAFPQIPRFYLKYIHFEDSIVICFNEDFLPNIKLVKN